MATPSSSLLETISVSMEGEKTDSTNPILANSLEENESQVPGTSSDEMILEVPICSPLVESHHSEGEELEEELEDSEKEEGEDEDWLWDGTDMTDDNSSDRKTGHKIIDSGSHILGSPSVYLITDSKLDGTVSIFNSCFPHKNVNQTFYIHSC